MPDPADDDLRETVTALTIRSDAVRPPAEAGHATNGSAVARRRAEAEDRVRPADIHAAETRDRVMHLLEDRA